MAGSIHIFLLFVFISLECCESSIWRSNVKASVPRAIRRSPIDTRQKLYTAFVCRGGSAAVADDESADEEEEEEEDNQEDQERELTAEEEKERLAVQKWRLNQQLLMQLRGFVLNDMLAKRGVPLTSLDDVSTPEGSKPPERVDWDCAMSTEEEPKSCLLSFDAAPNTKVLAPIGTTKDWVTLTSLNRLRRTDPSKVNAMFYNKFALLESWFDDSSEYSLLQHVGFKGFLITLLLDSANGMLLRTCLVLGVFSVVLLFMPVIEFVVGRMLVSSALWLRWPKWGRFVHAALPLKLFFGQMTWKLVAAAFKSAERQVRDYIIELECELLEECTPLTVGPGSQLIVEGEQEDTYDDDEDDNDDEDDGNNDDDDYSRSGVPEDSDYDEYDSEGW